MVFRTAFHYFVLMERTETIPNRALKIIFKLVKPTILLLLIFFNSNNVKAQFWKSKSNANKIDSLESVINRDRETYNKKLKQYYLLTTCLSNKVDSLRLDLDYTQQVLDSLAFAVNNTASSKNSPAVEPRSDSSSAFCPDDEMLQQVEYLKNCCCLLDQGCPNKTQVGGLRIVKEGYQMAILRKDIVIGSCWDFINKVYSNAGFQGANRETIYKGKKGTRCPTPELLQPGDWVYHVNYSYHNIEHSAIFICWKDYDKRMAVTLSYVGQNKSAPGKYGVYDLSGVYNVMRAKE